MAIVTPHDPSASTRVGPEPVPVEAKAEEVKVEPKAPEITEAERFNQLARREKILRNRARELETRGVEFSQREEALKTQLAEIEASKQWKDMLTTNPLHVLQQAGVTSDQLTNMLLNQPDMTMQQIAMMQAKIKSLEDSQNQSMQKIKDGQDKAYGEAVKQITTEVKLMVQGSDEFETIQNMNAQDAVVKLIEQTFEKDGFLMSVEDAAKEVEEYLVEEALKMANLKKIKSRLNLPPSEMAIQKPTTKGPTTLSHSIQQQSKPLSSKDRVERAKLAFQGKLTE